MTTPTTQIVGVFSFWTWTTGTLSCVRRADARRELTHREEQGTRLTNLLDKLYLFPYV